MSRFFFHVREKDVFSPDTEGQDLPNLDAARKEAFDSNREIMGERMLHGGDLDGRKIEIADDTGRVLATVSAKDVLYQGGHLSVFEDDVTKSAPVTNPISENPSSK